MDQHWPNRGSMAPWTQVAPSLLGGTAACSMATGVVTTRLCVQALLTTVTIAQQVRKYVRRISQPTAIHLSTVLAIYLSIYPLVYVSISHQASSFQPLAAKKK